MHARLKQTETNFIWDCAVVLCCLFFVYYYYFKHFLTFRFIHGQALFCEYICEYPKRYTVLRSLLRLIMTSHSFAVNINANLKTPWHFSNAGEEVPAEPAWVPESGSDVISLTVTPTTTTVWQYDLAGWQTLQQRLP